MSLNKLLVGDSWRGGMRGLYCESLWNILHLSLLSAACKCNSHASVCHVTTGKCFCTTKGIKGDHCQLWVPIWLISLTWDLPAKPDHFLLFTLAAFQHPHWHLHPSPMPTVSTRSQSKLTPNSADRWLVQEPLQILEAETLHLCVIAAASISDCTRFHLQFSSKPPPLPSVRCLFSLQHELPSGGPFVCRYDYEVTASCRRWLARPLRLQPMSACIFMHVRMSVLLGQTSFSVVH